jgi:hypothetical protein
LNCVTLSLIVAGLFFAWIIGPTVVLDYRRNLVPLRCKEIEDRFSAQNLGEALAPSEERFQNGAWHYARLLNPAAVPENPNDAIEKQFYRFHGWGRYWMPLTLVIILSGLMLAFSGLWLTEYLHSSTFQAPATENSMIPVAGPNSSNVAPVPEAGSTSPAKSTPLSARSDLPAPKCSLPAAPPALSG